MWRQLTETSSRLLNLGMIWRNRFAQQSSRSSPSHLAVDQRRNIRGRFVSGQKCGPAQTASRHQFDDDSHSLELRSVGFTSRRWSVCFQRSDDATDFTKKSLFVRSVVAHRCMIRAANVVNSDCGGGRVPLRELSSTLRLLSGDGERYSLVGERWSALTCRVSQISNVWTAIRISFNNGEVRCPQASPDSLPLRVSKLSLRSESPLL